MKLPLARTLMFLLAVQGCTRVATPDCDVEIRDELHVFAAEQLKRLSTLSHPEFHSDMLSKLPWLEDEYEKVNDCIFQLARAGEGGTKQLGRVFSALQSLTIHYEVAEPVSVRRPADRIIVEGQLQKILALTSKDDNLGSGNSSPTD